MRNLVILCLIFTSFYPLISHATPASLRVINITPQDLKQWFTASKDTLLGPVDVAQTTWGYGLVATQPIRKGETIMILPPHVTINVPYARSELIREGSFPQDVVKEMDQTVALGLQVLRERRKGVESTFLTYIKTVPQKGEDIGTALFLSDNSLRCAGKSVQLEKKDLLVFSNLMEDTLRNATDPTLFYFHEENGETDDVTTLCKWVLSVMVSRGFQLPLGQTLLPFMDMINHSPNFNVEMDDSKKHTGKVHIITTKDIAAGEELLTEYFESNRAMEHVLSTYGFYPSESKVVGAGNITLSRTSLAHAYQPCIDATLYTIHKDKGEADTQFWECLMLETLGKDNQKVDEFLNDRLDTVTLMASTRKAAERLYKHAEKTLKYLQKCEKIVTSDPNDVAAHASLANKELLEVWAKVKTKYGRMIGKK